MAGYIGNKAVNLSTSGADISGTANLDVVDIDGAVDMASTLAVAGVVTANAGVVVDNITIDGTEIDLSSGDLTIDVAGDIILDADGAEIILKDAGTRFGTLFKTGNDFGIKSNVADGDLLFKGEDNTTSITALTLDMSEAGRATFNDVVRIPTNLEHAGDADTFFGFPGANNFVITAGNVSRVYGSASETVINEDSANLDFRVEGNNVSNGIVYDADDETVCFFTNTTSSSVPSGLNFKRDGANNGWQNIGHTTAAGDGFSYLQFMYNSGRIGQAAQSGTTGVTYQTTSDYRLKENAVAITSATERVKQLNPIRFNFISEPDRTIDGFLAHEVQTVVPEAVSGTKDEVDSNGSPEYQGLDTSRLVPVLVATIKELEARITALENA